MESNLQKIENLLKNNKDGFTVSEIARKVNCSRNTARAYIERLIGEGKINIRKIGPSKLITYRGK